ncbi:ABC transporter substrate-binding protein [Agaricicola taiwanensis]|uniref:ABC transporter substrate-binding protein n=1 Tax=Agaricicola taiwanensis TaxID=591372 RepID=A0A8J2VXA1_9RHOB|nr:iron ABC transporter permease [Agaricicola taiwanensis]GGE38236.1 ABC transporter substrate-binding protein [Agaricicola taiwanensis]
MSVATRLRTEPDGSTGTLSLRLTPASIAQWVLLPLFLLVLAVLILLPVLVLVVGSFLAEPPRAFQFDLSTASLANYYEVLRDPEFAEMVYNTIVAAIIGTVGAVLVGLSLAWVSSRTNTPGRKFIEYSAVLPMMVPPLVGAFAWDILGSPQSGMLNVLLRSAGIDMGFSIYTMWGICLVFVIYYSPYVFLFTNAALKNADASLEEAASMCGASRLRVILQITLPLVLPAILSAALMVLVLLIEIFAIPAVLAETANIKFISVQIWKMIGFAPPKVNQASALGVMLITITVVLVLIQQKLTSKQSFVTVSGKGSRPRVMEFGWTKWIFTILSLTYIFIAVVLPLISLLYVSVKGSLFFSSAEQMLDTSDFTTTYYSDVLADPVISHSMINTLLVCGGTVGLGVFLYFAVAYLIHKTNLKGRRMLDIISVLPVAVPGMIIGLGYLWSWISIPIGLYGTLMIIILAYISQFTPQGSRAIGASLVQIHRELEESSRMSGAGFTYTLRRIVFPLALPGIFAAITLLLVLSFRELATALFLYTAKTQVFSLVMLDLWLRGSTNYVAVLAILQVCVLLVIYVLGNALKHKYER